MKILGEAFDVTRRKIGEIPFKSSALNDPHIKDLIQHTSQKTGVPVADLINKLKTGHIDKIEEFKKYSKVLYDTMSKNIVETAAFDLIEHSSHPGKVEYNQTTFNKLLQMVEFEHESFFPLRAPGEHNYIFHVDPIIVPSERWKQYNDIGTAAATASGHFIFNKPFMQKLLDWASIEGLKPKGKKYISNGGDIPDQYGYIEFLIMHELLHYAYGDFAAGKRLKQYSHKEHNWASDFRSNYMLVKNGYSQLPIGLFSDFINYDRQGSYDQMVKLVHDELKKLPEDLQDQFEKSADLDAHGEPGDGEGEPGENTGEVPSQDDIQKDIDKKMGNRQEVDSKEAEEKSKEGKGPGNKAGNPGKGSMDELGSRKDEIDKIKPKMNWKALIRKMVSSATILTDLSYAKPSRRSITGISIAAQTGAGAMKPGEKNIEQQFNKLVLVFDTSGSMYAKVPLVLSEAKSLLKQLGKVSAPIGIVFFAGESAWFQINIGKNTYTEIKNIGELSKPQKSANKGWEHVLTLGSSGGTDFSNKLSGDLNSLAGQGYNIMIFSDMDITYGENWENFSKLWLSHKANVFFVAETESTWKAICHKLQQVPGTFSHF